MERAIQILPADASIVAKHFARDIGVLAISEP